MAGYIEVQREEVENLTEKYGKFCKVISNIGDFSNVVSLHRPNSPLVIKFQLDGKHFLYLRSCQCFV